VTIKRMAEFKRDDYTYTSPDDDEWQITIVQTDDRKYVEIKKSDGECEVSWDLEMLLDISDAVRSAIREPNPTSIKKHNLQSPNIIDHRDQNETPADQINASVTESMKNVDSTVSPVESLTASTLEEDISRRKSGVSVPSENAKIKRMDL